MEAYLVKSAVDNIKINKKRGLNEKIYVILICFMLSITAAYAANWQEYNYKSYIDLNSFVYTSNYNNDKIVTFWEKALNDGSEYFKPINNQKIWFNLYNNSINCSQKSINVKYRVSYNLKAYVIESIKFIEEWTPIAPDTLAYNMYEFVCFDNRTIKSDEK